MNGQRWADFDLILLPCSTSLPKVLDVRFGAGISAQQAGEVLPSRAATESARITDPS